MPRKDVPSMEYITNLYESGNLQELRSINETLAKRANWRLSDLENKGLDSSAAYTRATYYLSEVSDYSSGDRFSRSKQMDIDSLYEQIKQESNFLRWQTSTAAGERERRERVFNTLEEKNLIEIPENMDKDAFKDKFLRFLSDDAWTEIKKHLYHKDILNEAGEAIAAGASVQELSQAMTDYMTGETSEDILTIWDNWKSATK
jgi:hypothetical protein